MSTVEKGFIFVLTNPSHPELVLIGAGADHPERALRAGLLVDSVTGQTPNLRYTALVQNIPASTQYIDDNLVASDFGIGYFEASAEEAIAAIRQGSASILYEEEIAAEQGHAIPVSDEYIDPSRQMVTVDEEDISEDDLWQRQTVRVNPRPRSWGPMPRGQRRSPSRTYRSNIKDRQLRKQNALRKLAASVDDSNEVDPRRDAAADSETSPALYKEKIRSKPDTKKADKDKREKTRRDQQQSGDAARDRDVDLKSKDEATMGHETSNLWQSREQPSTLQKPDSEQDDVMVPASPHPQRSDDRPPQPVATPMSRDTARIDLPEETDDILEDISVNWLWQRNNDVNIRRESTDSFDIDKAELDALDAETRMDRMETDALSSSSKAISNPPPHPSPKVPSAGQTARSELQPEPVSAIQNEAGESKEAPKVEIPSASESVAAVDFLAEVPLASEADKLEMRTDPQKPVKQVRLPDERMRKSNSPASPAKPANDETLTPNKLNVPSNQSEVPVVKIPGTQKTVAESRPQKTAPSTPGDLHKSKDDLTQTTFSPPVDPAPQPVPLEPEQTNAKKNHKANRKDKAAPLAPPAPPRSQHDATTELKAQNAPSPIDLPDALHSTEKAPAPQPKQPAAASESIDIPPPDLREIPGAELSASEQDPSSPQEMDARQITSWVKGQEETHNRKTNNRRALRLALLGIPLGALAGAAYLMAQPALLQPTKIAIVLGAIVAGVVVCYLLARIFARKPEY